MLWANTQLVTAIKQKRTPLLGMLGVLFVAGLSLILFSQNVFAAAPVFKDQNTITFNGKTFSGPQPGELYQTTNVIWPAGWPGTWFSPALIQVDAFVDTSDSSVCPNMVFFPTYTNGIGGDFWDYQQKPLQGAIWKTTESDDKKTCNVTIPPGRPGGAVISYLNFENVPASIPSHIPPQDTKWGPQDPGSGTGGGGGNGGDDSDQVVCGSGQLDWIICPAIALMQTASKEAAQQLDGALRLNPLGTTGTNSSIYTLWKDLLNVANVVLVIGFLLIVASQATSFGISNYGIKKMLPRIIAAAILMNLSYFICQILVDASNIVGAGAAELVQSATGGKTFSASVTTQVNTFSQTVAGVTIAAIIVFFFLIPVVFAILAVFFTIAARSAIVILLVIVAPLAFAAWVLPGTESYFRKWWKLLVAMLVLYPMVMLLFAASIVASEAVIAADPKSLFERLIGLIILTLPLFALPFIFKAAGGVLGQIHGMSQRFGKKAADPLHAAVSPRLRRYGKFGAIGAGNLAGLGVKKVFPGAGSGRTSRFLKGSTVGVYKTIRAGDKAIEMADAARKQGKQEALTERAAHFGSGVARDGDGNIIDTRGRMGQLAGTAISSYGGSRYAEIVSSQIEEAFGKRVKAIKAELELRTMDVPALGRELRTALKEGEQERASALINHLGIAGGGSGRALLENVLETTEVKDQAMKNAVSNAVFRDTYSSLIGKRGGLAKGGYSGDTWESRIDKVPTESLASSDVQTLRKFAAQGKIKQSEAEAIFKNPSLWSKTYNDEARSILEDIKNNVTVRSLDTTPYNAEKDG